MSSLEVYTPPMRRDWLELWAPSIDLAKAIANTPFVPEAMRGNPAMVAAAMLYGDEVGLGPMQSLAKIAVIEGRPALYAEAQRALVYRAGHELWLVESTNSRATWSGRRRDSDETSSVTWTMDDAKRAGLHGRKAWRLYPRAMLSNRASAELCKAVFADAIGGLAAVEELEELEEPLEPAPTSGTRRRRRAPLAAVAAPETPPAAEELPPLPGEETEAPEPVSTPAPGGSESEPPQSVGGAAAGDDPAPSEPQASADEPITEAQLRKLMASYRDAGFGEDREARLALARVVIGRPLESSRDLTKAEASRVIDALEGHRLGQEYEAWAAGRREEWATGDEPEP
jgi:hypothetical protein